MEGAHEPEGAEESAESDEHLLTLSSSTLDALASFLDEQAADFDAVVSLTTQFCPPNLADLQLGHVIDARTQIPTSKSCKDQKRSDHLGDETKGLDVSGDPRQSQAVPVHKFKRLFKENWQLSQFWYTQDTAERLAQAVKGVSRLHSRIAFVCCPTGYVAFNEIALPTQTTLLLEYDRRFSIVAGANFCYYDLDEPLSLGRVEALRGSQDVVVVDPPFHSEVSQKKIVSTVAHILCPGGRLVVLTGLVLSSLISSIYHSPLPKLRRRGMVIEHDGVGRLATPYGCWTGGGPHGQDEEGFGKPIHDES